MATLYERDDQFEIKVPAPRSRVLMILLAGCLVFWTLAGVSAILMLFRVDTEEAGRAFLRAWLWVWGAGEAALLLPVVWMVSGVERVTVTKAQVRWARELGSVGPVRTIEREQVISVEATQESLFVTHQAGTKRLTLGQLEPGDVIDAFSRLGWPSQVLLGPK